MHATYRGALGTSGAENERGTECALREQPPADRCPSRMRPSIAPRPLPLVARNSVAIAMGAVAFVLLLAGVCGCSSIPNGTRAVDSVDVKGNETLSSSDIEDKIATTESSRSFSSSSRGSSSITSSSTGTSSQEGSRAGRGVLPRARLLRRARSRRPSRVRRQEARSSHDRRRRRAARARSGRGPERPRVAPRGRRARGRERVGGETSQGGQVQRRRLHADRRRTCIAKALTDNGYAYAKTARRAEIDLAGHYALVSYDVVPGPPAKFGEVKDQRAWDRFQKAPVRRALSAS